MRPIERFDNGSMMRGILMLNPIFPDRDRPSLTGTMLLEMSPEEADRLGRDVANLVIVKDRPVDLIRPIQNIESFKEQLDIADIWHLESIRHAEVKHTGKNIKIAVLDTGIDPRHPEIRGKVTEAYLFDIQRGIIEEVDIEEAEDTEGHGTHVAGLICGQNIGVAPEAEVISVTMIPDGRGSIANFIAAFSWLRDRDDVRIANISAGLPEAEYIPTMSNEVNALLALGILPICAIGNEGRNKTRTPGNCVEVVSVGASDRSDRVAEFSGNGAMLVDNQLYNVPSLVAPGKEVYSCRMSGGYIADSGTSMAAPIVSGVAALILEENPRISVYGLREELLRRCRLLESVESERQGKGLIQVK